MSKIPKSNQVTVSKEEFLSLFDYNKKGTPIINQEREKEFYEKHNISEKSCQIYVDYSLSKQIKPDSTTSKGTKSSFRGTGAAFRGSASLERLDCVESDEESTLIEDCKGVGSAKLSQSTNNLTDLLPKFAETNLIKLNEMDKMRKAEELYKEINQHFFNGKECIRKLLDLTRPKGSIFKP